jgi:hypothetical protein
MYWVAGQAQVGCMFTYWLQTVQPCNYDNRHLLKLVVQMPAAAGEHYSLQVSTSQQLQLAIAENPKIG